MNEALKTKLRLIKLSNMKPDYSESGRIHGLDSRTVKSTMEGTKAKQNIKKYKIFLN